MSLEKALGAIGFQEAEATVISFMFEREKCTANDLIEGTSLSRGTIYKALKSLIEQNYVVKTATKPVEYSLAPQVPGEIKKQFSTFYKKVSASIKPRKIPESRIMLRRISTIFEKNGYAIREPPRISPETRVSRFRRLGLIDKIAEGEYSFGISLIDKKKKFPYPKEILYSFLLSEFRQISIYLNCITTFVFVHTDRRDHQSLYRNLKRQKPPRPIFRRPVEPIQNYGIEHKRLICFKTDENLVENIPNVLHEIHHRRIIVGNMARTLKEKIDQIHELILLSQEHARGIDRLLLTKSPFERDIVGKAFDEITDPIQSIKNRENRNIGIFRRKFSESEVSINQSLDAIERRIYLPELSSLEEYLTELEGILEKFRPIEYELSDLSSSLFKYGVDMIESHRSEKRATINPFVFTEPYERDVFFVDQESLEKAADMLAKSILEDLPGFFQIVIGEAGVGKTHAARYIYEPMMEKQRIKALYIDCPLNYDLIAGIFQELTQESLYPEHLVASVRELRRAFPSTVRELLRFLDDVASLWKNQGYDGLLLILDELENTLPYIFFEEESRFRYQPPLALRQIREILSQRLAENTGFLFCCRSKIFPMLEQALKMENIKEFTYTPENLRSDDFADIIKHRYVMWSISNGPIFEKNALDSILEITHSNTRDVIKYCRELFKFAVKNKLQSVSKDTIKKIGAIPLFRY